MNYLVQYNTGTEKVSEFFDKLSDAIKFFEKAETDGYFAALYNCK